MQNPDFPKRYSLEGASRGNYLSLPMGIVFLAGLVLTSSYSYILFHNLAEVFSIVIAFGIFVIVWNSRMFLSNNYLLIIGIAYLFAGGLDLIHMLAYKGMNVFKFTGANPPTQLWIAARSLQSVSLLIAPFFIGRKVNHRFVVAAYAAVFSFLIWSIFSRDIFPVCYIDGTGLTPFKKNAEYVISFLLLLSGMFLVRQKTFFDNKVTTYLLLSIATSIISELAFTFYVGVYDLSNMVGHLSKIISFYFIYLAVIKTGLQDPYDIIFRNMKQSREELQKAKEELEQRVQDRTGELVKANELLKQEIKEREKVEQGLRENESTLRSFYENAPVMMGIVELTEQDEIIHLYDNPRTAEFFGVANEEMKNKPAAEIGAPDEAVRLWVAHYHQSRREGRPVQFEYEHQGPDGPLWLLATVSQIESASPGRMRFSYVAENVSERRKLEAQLRQSQKMEAIGHLAGGIAHDFNNILSAIMGYGYILNKKMQEDDPLRKYVEYLLESAERAAFLTRSLLAFSRKQILHRNNIDVNEVIGRVQKYLQRIIEEDIELITVFRKKTAVINADSTQLEQIMVNLAANARDAMPQGGSLTIETDEVEIDHAFIRANGYGERGKYVRISFSDTGIGMDEKTKKRVFEPFFTTKEPGKGTGLGLSIIYGIVKQHRGYINVFSEPGKGATFTMYFPLSQAAPQDGKKGADDESAPLKLGTETILLAEDDAVVRRLTRAVLEDFGFTVIEAVNGEDAVNMYFENKDKVQLLILDVIMPRKSGKEAYDEIKKARPAIKAIFISGYTGDKIQSDGPLQPDVELLHKPVSPRELLIKVRAILDS